MAAWTTGCARIASVALATMALSACELIVGTDDRVVEATPADAATDEVASDGASLVDVSRVSSDASSRADAADASVVLPPADAAPRDAAPAPDASSCAACAAQSDACQRACAQTSATCQSRCSNPGCLNRCTKDEQQCGNDCAKACSMCEMGAQCGGMSSCGGGGN